MIEIGIAAVLGAMLTSGALLFISDYLQGQAAQAQGQALFAINQAVNSYESKYSVQLANNQPIAIPGYANVANIYQPTLAELYELNLLPNSTPSGHYGIQVGRTLTGGVPSGLVWISTPFLNNAGEVDQSLAGAAMLAAGGDAGMSTQANPAQIAGIDNWSAPNPVSGNPAGILAMRNGAGSGAYVRLDGSTPMQGSLNLNGNNVTGGGTLAATSVTASNVSANSITAANLNSTSVTASNVTASTVTTSGNISAGGSASGSTLTATSYGNDVFFGSSALYSDGSNSVVRSNGGALYVQDKAGNDTTIVAGQYVSPGGNGVQVGSSYYYGDGTNSAIRQNGGLYVQNQNGSGFANTYGNDFYIAAIGKWASQLGGGGYTVAVNSGSWQSSAVASCPSGYTVTGGSCDFYRGGDGREISPRSCDPYGNGYYCNEGNGGTCIAYAICQPL